MTREEARRWLEVELKLWEDECKSKHPIKEALSVAIKALEQEPRWIPVSERLPKEGKEVLVSGYDTYNKKVIISRYQGEQYGFICGLVSAWMPLPTSYQGEKK